MCVCVSVTSCGLCACSEASRLPPSSVRESLCAAGSCDCQVIPGGCGQWRVLPRLPMRMSEGHQTPEWKETK